MLIGHYAVGFAAKKWAPKTSLGLLFAAAVWLDIVWPIFVMLGLEHFNIAPGITRMSPFDFTDYPLSHSLVMALAWGAGFGLIYLIWKNDSKAALILGGLVVSHWFLDLLVHRPDLPLLPEEVKNYMVQAKYGLGLWNHPTAEIILEGGLLALGILIYLKSTKAVDQVGNIGLWAFVFFLVTIFIVSLNAAPPTNPMLVAFVGQLQLLLIGWAYWLDEHRKVV